MLKDTIKAYVMLSAYFITLFALCLTVTIVLTTIFGYVGNLQALQVMGTLVFLLLGGVDFILIFKGKVSPTLIVWSIPVLFYVIYRNMRKKKPTINYDAMVTGSPGYVRDTMQNLVRPPTRVSVRV